MHESSTVQEYDVHQHVSPTSTYLKIFAGLVVLTLLTVAVYQVHLGALNLVVAIVIATIKATFVVLYFMHMKYENKFNALVFVSSLLFAGIFLAYTLNDTEYRGRANQASEYGGALVDPATGKRAYGSPALLNSASDIPKDATSAAAK